MGLVDEPSLPEVCDWVEMLHRNLPLLFQDGETNHPLEHGDSSRVVESIRSLAERFPYDQLLRVRRCNNRMGGLRGTFPLHFALAMMRKQSLDPDFERTVVEALLEIFGNEARVVNSRERLPLHVYLAQSKKGDAQPRVVLALIEAYPMATTHWDSIGRYPLHLALSRGNSLAVIEPLLRGCPEAVLEKDDAGWTISQLLERNYDEADRETIRGFFREELSRQDFEKAFPKATVKSNISYCSFCQRPNPKFLFSAKKTINLNGKDELICLKCAKFNGYEEFEEGDY